MQETGVRNGAHGADKFGFKDLAGVHWNLLDAVVVEHAIRNGEGSLVHGGAFCAETGVHTGRSPKDKYTVADALTENSVWWDGNRKLAPENFKLLYDDMIAHARGKTLYAQDLYGGADPKYRIKTRVFTELAWHSLFIRQLLIRPPVAELANFIPELTIVDLPSFKADPKRHGVRTDTIIAIDFTKKIILIGNSSYAGEIKKSVFTTLNFYLPAQGVVPMHCSANVGKDGDVALFFGLSGTGKTTLSADPNRTLIGDDEHGWSEDGIFNFEGGCYAKCIKLSAEAEPEIYAATNRFGTVLENVVFDPQTRICDFDSDKLTENTRSAYPLEFMPLASRSGCAGQPKNIVFLTADAFGVMPPIAKLTPAQAMYHFLSGYTAKVARHRRARRFIEERELSHRSLFRLRGADFGTRRRAASALSDEDLEGQSVIRHDRPQARRHVSDQLHQIRKTGRCRSPRRRAGRALGGGVTFNNLQFYVEVAARSRSRNALAAVH